MLLFICRCSFWLPFASGLSTPVVHWPFCEEIEVGGEELNTYMQSAKKLAAKVLNGLLANVASKYHGVGLGHHVKLEGNGLTIDKRTSIL